MYYKDKKYFLAIQDYKKGDNTSVISILKMLSKKNLTKFNDDINGFITEVQSIAKKNRDSVVIAYTKEVGNKISLIDGNSHGKTSAYENVLETETECKVALKKALENDEFNVVINNIIRFIKENKKFHTAVVILELIHSINYNSDIFTKDEVAMLFIEKMFMVIVNDVRPAVSGTLVKKYSSSWPNFNSQDFIYYHSIVRLYTKKYGIKEIISNVLEVKEEQQNSIALNKHKMSFPYELVFYGVYETYHDGHMPFTRKFTLTNITYDGNEYTIKVKRNDCLLSDTLYVVIDGTKKQIDEQISIKAKKVSEIEFELFLQHYKRPNGVIVELRTPGYNLGVSMYKTVHIDIVKNIVYLK